VFDLVTVGHFVIDLIISPRIACPKATLGGPAAFVSLAANKLDAKVSVVSKVGVDFQEYLAWLRRNNIDMSQVKILENAFSTRFVLTYYDGKRRLQIKNRAPQIFPEDIPDSLRAMAIHVAPVANELSVEVIRKLRRKTQLLSIDPQGFLREFDETGNTRPKRLNDMSFLRHCDVFKSTIEEIKTMTGHAKLGTAMKQVLKCGVKTVLVTMGEKGVLACFGQELYHILACKPKILKDPTGAGDVLIGAFLAEYIRGRESLWCCCVGSSAASFIVEDVGSRRFGKKSEVYERATKIYEKGIKPLRNDTTCLEGAVVGKNR
jgi:sugar/nucleoside kinase (ribokinase family)